MASRHLPDQKRPTADAGAQALHQRDVDDPQCESAHKDWNRLTSHLQEQYRADAAAVLSIQEVADGPFTQSVLASCLTYAQRDAAPDTSNDAVADALLARLTAEGWYLAKVVKPLNASLTHRDAEAVELVARWFLRPKAAWEKVTEDERNHCLRQAREVLAVAGEGQVGDDTVAEVTDEEVRYRTALEQIASCASVVPGDCPDIAQAALGATADKEKPDPLAVRCPKCQALPGVRCDNEEGDTLLSPHRERVAADKEAHGGK